MKGVVDFLNVGFGEATVVRMVEAERSFCLVVDGGDVDPLTNPRRCSLEQYMKEQAIERIDVLIITHFHRDHIGGLLAVIGKVTIGQIWLHMMLPAHILQSGLDNDSTPLLASLTLYKELLNKAKRLALPIKLVKEPHSFHEQGISFKLLMPNRDRLQMLEDELDKLDIERLDQQQERLNVIDRLLNETALALLIRSAGKSAVLLTSDVGLDFWQPYMSEIGQVHVLQAPHHGDARHISKQWLGQLSPQIVIVSADDEGTYQLPQQQFEDMVRAHSQAEVYYTEAATTTHSIIRMYVNEWRLELVE